MNLASLVTVTRWTPRAAFPPSEEISNRIFSCGKGIYLLTNPRRGEGDPVRGVGWAESDYWARRAWDNPPFTGDLQAPPPQWQPPPSLEFLGRPQRLSFNAVCEYERSRLTAPDPTMVSGYYRLTDGAFLSVRVTGAEGVYYDYAGNEPKPEDLPVAIEVRLPERR